MVRSSFSCYGREQLTEYRLCWMRGLWVPRGYPTLSVGNITVHILHAKKSLYKRPGPNGGSSEVLSFRQAPLPQR